MIENQSKIEINHMSIVTQAIKAFFFEQYKQNLSSNSQVFLLDKNEKIVYHIH